MAAVAKAGPDLQAMGITAPSIDVKEQTAARLLAEATVVPGEPVVPQGELHIMTDQNGREFRQYRYIRGKKVNGASDGGETLTGSTPEIAELRREIAELKALLQARAQ